MEEGKTAEKTIDQTAITESKPENKRGRGLSVDVVIPVCNPDEKLLLLVDRLSRQTVRPRKLLMIVTGESLGEAALIGEKLGAAGILWEIRYIRPEEFDHGGTRHMAAEQCQGELLLFMTQDAVPKDRYMVEKLQKAFEEPNVAAAYARQLPAPGCRVIERYTRSFNYPKESRVKTLEDLDTLGIKAFFCSNVCAAYRRSVYEEMGGFPRNTIFNEDMIFAGRLMQAGYGIAYVAEAKVIHSHNYSVCQQFRRNFDLAVSQKQFPEVFGGVKSETEGLRLVRKTAAYLMGKGYYSQLPMLAVGSGAKFLGYRFGKIYDKLPGRLVIRMSMNRGFWEK